MGVARRSRGQSQMATPTETPTPIEMQTVTNTTTRRTTMDTGATILTVSPPNNAMALTSTETATANLRGTHDDNRVGDKAGRDNQNDDVRAAASRHSCRRGRVSFQNLRFGFVDWGDSSGYGFGFDTIAECVGTITKPVGAKL